MDKPQSPDLRPTVARRIVERLKAGAAPDEGIELFTAGRDRWLKALARDLEDVADGDAKLRIFNGRYGDGKTHLMKLTRHLALSAGFVTAYVPISKDVPLSNWSALYRGLVQSLQTAGRPNQRGLGAVLDPNDRDPAIAAAFDAKAESVRSLTSLHPDFLTAVYRFTTIQGTSVDSAADLLTLRSWFEGQPVARRVLTPLGISRAVEKQDGPRMLQSLVGVLRHFGFAGLLLLIDEVESILSQRSSAVRAVAYENLRLFIDRDVLPTHCLAVFSTTPEMFSAPQEGFQSYPALWSRIRPPDAQDAIDYRATVVDLPRTPPTRDDFSEIGRRIREIHEIGYSWKAEQQVSDGYIASAALLAASGELALTYSPTRVFVKLMAEELDLASQSSDYTADPARLRRRFQAVDEALDRDLEQWSEARV
jgi:hypothetical protein